jgi:carbon monoxide dehydrogenase subunit G
VASIFVEIPIDASPDDAWAALRDWGALHELAPGFVLETKVDGEDRLVTFFTGRQVRERIIAVDDERRRLAWTLVDGPYAHYNGAAQVTERDGGGTLFGWTADLLPHEGAEQTRELMERGAEAIKGALEASRAAA